MEVGLEEGGMGRSLSHWQSSKPSFATGRRNSASLLKSGPENHRWMWMLQGTESRWPKYTAYLGRPGYCSFPALRPSTAPSTQSPDRPTPPERSLEPHQRMSPNPENWNPHTPDEVAGETFRMKRALAGTVLAGDGGQHERHIPDWALLCYYGAFGFADSDLPGRRWNNLPFCSQAQRVNACLVNYQWGWGGGGGGYYGIFILLF